MPAAYSAELPIRTSLDHKTAFIKRLNSSDSVNNHDRPTPKSRTDSQKLSGGGQRRKTEESRDRATTSSELDSGFEDTDAKQNWPLVTPTEDPARRARVQPTGLTTSEDYANGQPRDDGYFANNISASVQEGYWATKVKLDAGSTMNAPVAPSALQDASAGDQDNRPERNSIPIREPQTDIHTSRFEGASTHQVSAHRISSPPVFQASSSLDGNRPPPPGKLQHRHTLEVPGLASSRTSRDNGSILDDAALATGRNTPSSPARRRGSMQLIRRNTRSLHSDLYLDEVPQDEEAARWAEVIRQRRASKRKRRDDEDDERVVMGTKVDQNHVNYVTAYNMLTGIRFTVSRTNAKLDRDLVEADFTASQKFSFDVYVHLLCCRSYC